MMLETSFERSGWIYKRIRLKTKWAVEIARQRVFGTRPIQLIEVVDNDTLKSGDMSRPERKAAAKAKKRFKEIWLQDQDKCNESIVKPNSLQIANSVKRNKKQNSARLDIMRSKEMAYIAEHKQENKNYKQCNLKLVENKAIKLNRKDKALLRQFGIKPCIVCIPLLTNINKTVSKPEEIASPRDLITSATQVSSVNQIPPTDPMREQNAENTYTNHSGVNKRKRKKPLKIIKNVGGSDCYPTIPSDGELNKESREPKLTPYNWHLNSSTMSCHVKDESDDDDDDDESISMADIHHFVDDGHDPNDADTEEEGFDETYIVDESIDENSDVFSYIVDNENVGGESDDSDDDNDNIEDFDGQIFDDDDEALMFSKAQTPKKYCSIRGKTLIAPATFQPTNYKVAPPKLILLSSFRAGAFLN